MAKWISLVQHYDGIPENVKFGPDDTLYEEEIGDGNLNDVARVYTKDPQDDHIVKSVIMKHAMPYIKCLGEDYPLSDERIYIEYKALLKFHTLSPGSVPHPYIYDEDNKAVCMEDLRGYEVLRHMLMRGHFDMKIATNIATHLAIIHRETHVATVGGEQIQHLVKKFVNPHMCGITHQYVFNGPFTKGSPNNRCSPEVEERLYTIYDDPVVMETERKMFDLFKNKKECLLHGDLHTGSFMVKGQDVRIFDVEFATVGPASFDVGMLLANYIFSYYGNMATEDNHNERRKFANSLIDVCKITVTTYLEHMTASSGNREEYVNNFLTEVAGFAGCEIIRRLVGTAHNADVEGKPLAEQDCLGAGVRLMQASHRIHNIDQLMVIALMLIF